MKGGEVKVKRLINKIGNTKNLVSLGLKETFLTILSLLSIENLSSKQIARLTVDDIDLVENELRLINKQKFQKMQKSTKKYLENYLIFRSKISTREANLLINAKGKKLTLKDIRKIIKSLVSNDFINR